MAKWPNKPVAKNINEAIALMALHIMFLKRSDPCDDWSEHEMANCPTCGRTVNSIFDHVDASCENWPDRWAEDRWNYRGYTIEPNTIVGGYDYVHDDYDEGDSRYGHEATIEDCYREIDEKEDEDA